MARLRIRVELNRRDSGVPLHTLVSVVEQTRKFLNALAQDVQIDAQPGEWLATGFDPESLNFTAEYQKPVTAEQVYAFGAAFGGATSLRQATIAQFTQIADYIGEDELIGFGLYRSDDEADPSDWRCLSRRDAVRIAGDIRMLAKAMGDHEQEAPLPAVTDGSANGRRLFKEKRERPPAPVPAEPTRAVKDLETTLLQRMAMVEKQMDLYGRKVEGMATTAQLADQRFQHLLRAMESFWAQAGSAQKQLAAPAAANQGGREMRWLWRGLAALLLIGLIMLGLVWYPEVEPRIEKLDLFKESESRPGKFR